MDEDEIASSREHQDTSLRVEEKVSPMNRSRNDFPSRMSTAKLSTIPSLNRMHSAPNVYKGVSGCPRVMPAVWLFEIWASFRSKCGGSFREGHHLANKVESGSCFKEAWECVPDYQRNSVRYEAFLCQLYLNFSFCCFRREREFSTKLISEGKVRHDDWFFVGFATKEIRK